MHSGQQAGCNRFHVTFHATNLPREENPRVRLHLQSLAQQSRRINVRITMNLSVTQKSRILQTRDQPQHTRLIAKLQMILEADQVVRIRPQVLLPQLHHRIWHFAGARIDESHRLHRTEAKRVASAPGNLLNRQTTFKVVQLFPVTLLDRVSGEESIVKAAVLLRRHRTIDVIRRSFVITRSPVDARHVDRIRLDNRADRIVEIQMRTMWSGRARPRRR